MGDSGMEKKPTIAIAGASRFIGKALSLHLAADAHVIGLTCKERTNVELQNDGWPQMEWRKADLFSLAAIEKGLEDADYAFYLIHSVASSARLTQGKAQDMHLILADNFARAAKKAGVKQIIYLGELIPEDEQALTSHLRSQLEIEETLSAHGVPVTVLRTDIASRRVDAVKLLAACIGMDNGDSPIPVAALDKERKRIRKKRFGNTVRSVQRLLLPTGRNAAWMGGDYARWLSRTCKPFIRVEQVEGRMHFLLWGMKKPLLELTYSEERSTPDRVLYYITGGMLARIDPMRSCGRLEFREVLSGTYVIVAIHEFVPRLPWLIYNATQALIHLWVMHQYGRSLRMYDR
ncbi:NmrA family NAD(P)-binding protein [Aneurinibacillus sp. REN35]|uniref:NmrA family NAD(P)-binding protein n=1 Tax=Aneurinibacillus sp. REN35 TaxID=3237286 RepID=UPI003527A4C1